MIISKRHAIGVVSWKPFQNFCPIFSQRLCLTKKPFAPNLIWNQTRQNLLKQAFKTANFSLLHLALMAASCALSAFECRRVGVQALKKKFESSTLNAQKPLGKGRVNGHSNRNNLLWLSILIGSKVSLDQKISLCSHMEAGLLTSKKRKQTVC